MDDIEMWFITVVILTVLFLCFFARAIGVYIGIGDQRITPVRHRKAMSEAAKQLNDNARAPKNKRSKLHRLTPCVSWRPQRDLNPCRRRERPVS